MIALKIRTRKYFSEIIYLLSVWTTKEALGNYLVILRYYAFLKADC